MHDFISNIRQLNDNFKSQNVWQVMQVWHSSISSVMCNQSLIMCQEQIKFEESSFQVQSLTNENIYSLTMPCIQTMNIN